jgi:predicted ArsR family transcriptional regulator
MANTLEDLLEKQKQAHAVISAAMLELRELRKHVGYMGGGRSSREEIEAFDGKVLKEVTLEKKTLGEIATALGVPKRRVQYAMERLVAKKLARKNRGGWGFMANV